MLSPATLEGIEVTAENSAMKLVAKKRIASIGA